MGNAKRVAILGAGVVGLSWTGLFLANGLEVTICDPRPDIRIWALGGLEKIKWSLASMGYPIEKFTRHLCFQNKLHKAVADVEVVQENVPDVLELKQTLYEKLGRFVQSNTLLLSSSARFSATQMSNRMKNPEQLMVGYAPDPPHLIPLVEVVPGAATSQDSIMRAMDFYRRLGKRPVQLGKELAGSVANRLYFALLREGFHLVNAGVITMESLDDLVRGSLGPRWAAAGPFKTMVLGGASGAEPLFDAATLERLRQQAARCYARVPVEDLAQERDEDQIAILRALRKQD